MQLSELLPNPYTVFDIPLGVLANNVLLVLKQGRYTRNGFAEIASLGYYFCPVQSDRKESVQDCARVIEEALMYLEHEMLIGRDPLSPDLIFITRKGRQQLEVLRKSCPVT